MRGHYFNEFDPFAAAWLRELIRAGHLPAGEVDERSITEVAPDDLRGFVSCHFFAGVGGWPLALRLADWPDDRPAWTGSCPCQPFSSAGKRKGKADDRDLWPEFYRLIRDRRPEVVFGEQVASCDVVGTELEAAFVTAVQGGDNAKANKIAERIAKRHDGELLEELAAVWVDRIRADLEGEGYAVRWKVLGAHSVGAPHIRQRLYWVAFHRDGRRPGDLADAERSGVRGDKRGVSGGEEGQVPGEVREQRVRADARPSRRRVVFDIDKCDLVELDPEQCHAVPLLGGRTLLIPKPGYVGHNHNRIPNPGRLGSPSRPGLPAPEREELRAAGRGQEGRATPESGGPSAAGVVGDPAGDRRSGDERLPGPGVQPVIPRAGGMGQSPGVGLEARDVRDAGEVPHAEEGQAKGAELRGGTGFWGDFEWIACRDGKARRTQPGLFPLAHGVSGRVAVARPEGLPEAATQEEVVRWVNRVGALRGAGNAIVPQIAAEFVRAFLEAEAEAEGRREAA